MHPFRGAEEHRVLPFCCKGVGHLHDEPPAMTVAQALYPTDPARRDDAYSELCSKRSRGRAVVWALQQGGQTVCTPSAPVSTRAR